MIAQHAVVTHSSAHGAPHERRGGWAVALLCASFVVSWSIEPELFESGPSLAAAMRWIIVITMCMISPLVSLSGVGRCWSIIAFVGAIGLTIPFSGALESSFPIFARILGAGVLAIFVGTLPFSQRIRVVRTLLFVIAALVICSLLLSFISPERAYRAMGIRPRLYGLTPHPAILSYLASLVATVFTSTALFTKARKMSRLRDGLLAVLSAVVIVMADSRTGEIALPAALLCQMAAFRLVKSRVLLRSIRLPWLTFAGAMVVCASLPIAVATRAIPVSIEENQYAGSTQSRLAIWSLGLSDFEDNVIVGNGLGTAFIVDDPNADKNFLLYYHSVLINYLAKTGLIGAAGFVVLLLSACYACLAYAQRIARQRSFGESEMILLSFIVAACSVTVAFATVEAALQNIYPSFLIFFLSITLPSRQLR